MILCYKNKNSFLNNISFDYLGFKGPMMFKQNRRDLYSLCQVHRLENSVLD